MSIVQVFGQSEVRFVEHPDGKYEFGVVAADVAVILELDPRQVNKMPVDNEWKGYLPVETLGGTQSMTVIWEPGIYQLLAKSRKPQGKAFFRWITRSQKLLKKDLFNAGANRYWGSKDDSGFIYLAQASQTRWCKIGMSKQPYKRMSSLQTGSPLEITLIHRVFTFNMPALEKVLHEYYDAYRLRGEWFDLPRECIKEFPVVANELDATAEQASLPE